MTKKPKPGTERYKSHRKLKKRTHERDNYTCKLNLSPDCLGDMRPRYEKYLRKQLTRKKVGLTVDHTVPLSKGGKWELDNLVTACEPCNSMKANHDELKKVLFLDIDGVLNSLAFYQKRARPKGCRWCEMDPEAMALFDEIVERTGCDVVLSSTWRLSTNWRHNLEREGLNTNSIIDRTPRMPRPVNTGVEYKERGKEIREWLKDKQYYVRVAILDDDSDFLSKQPLFKTDWNVGLTREITEAVIAHLNAVKI